MIRKAASYRGVNVLRTILFRGHFFYCYECRTDISNSLQDFHLNSNFPLPKKNTS